MTRLCTLVTVALFTGAAGWSRLNVGTDKRGNTLTCGGAVMSEQIKKNILGQNPDVPVSIIARYPFLDPLVKGLSDFHVYCAVLLMIIVTIQMFRPKGTVPAKAVSHIWIGRILSWGIAPHYVLVGMVLNYYAINLDLKDWQLAPPASAIRLSNMWQ